MFEQNASGKCIINMKRTLRVIQDNKVHLMERGEKLPPFNGID
jgi:hypothetical protein